MIYPPADTTKESACKESILSWLPCPFSQMARKEHNAVDELAANAALLSNDWRVQWFHSIEEGIQAWQTLSPTPNLFVSSDYFSLLQELELGGVQTGLAIFSGPNGEQIGMILQQFGFNANEQIGGQNVAIEELNWRDRTWLSMKRQAGKWLNYRVLTAGQMHLTGHHALRGLDSAAAQKQLLPLLVEGLEKVADHWPEKVHALMLKDMDLDQHPKGLGFATLPVQPNMILDLQPEWQSFDDYLGAMASKYRVRARRARKKGKDLECREFTYEDIVRYEERMYALYLNIAEDSDYNVVTLPPNYFSSWKAHFHGRFRLWGYFKGDELVGFCSAIYNDGEMEAHFMGFESSFNRETQLYLNMLYHLVEVAIESRMSHLVFARTALEIKSSIGAVPHELHCWLRSRIRLFNPLIPLVAPILSPLPEWQQRHPFK